MAPLFKKLPGFSSKTEEPEEESRFGPRSTSAKPLEKPHHLAIDQEESSDEPQEEMAGTDDEGELTVDIYEKDDSIVIQSTVAGVKPETLDVSITDDTITIRGERRREEEIQEENYYYKELFWGTFSRSVILPEEIDEDSAEATLKHGLLTIKLPKKRRGQAQKLKVKLN